MSGLNLLGGLAQGITQGLNNTMTIQNTRARQQESDARLAMLQDEHNWRAKQQQAAEEERQRVGMLEKISQEELLSYQEETGKQDLDRFDLAEVQARAGKKAFQSGFLPATEYTKAAEIQRQLRESGVADLYMKTAINDDWDAFNKRFAPMFGGATAKPMGDDILITTPDGRQTPVSRIGFESLLKLDLTASAQKSAFDGQKARAEVDKIASEAEENRANAGKLRADARHAGSVAGKNAPANVQAAEWYSRATPEQRSIFDRINKIERAPDVAKVATTIFTEAKKAGEPITIDEARRQARQLVGVEDVPDEVRPAIGKDGIAEPKSAAERAALPSGTRYRSPDGQIRIVP